MTKGEGLRLVLSEAEGMTKGEGLRLVLSEILRLRLRMTVKKSEGMTERLFHAFFNRLSRPDPNSATTPNPCE